MADIEQEAFESWYTSQDRSLSAAEKAFKLPQDLQRQSSWRRKAAQRDDVQASLDRQLALQSTKEATEEHRSLCRRLQRLGIDYLETFGIDSAANALTAIKIGIELERKTLALPDQVVSMLAQPEEDLVSRARQLVHTLIDAKSEAESENVSEFDGNNEF